MSKNSDVADTEEINDSDSKASVPPPDRKEVEPESEIDEEDQDAPNDNDDEHSLYGKMISAGYYHRDKRRIEDVFEKWMALNDREWSDAVIVTLRSEMRLRAGVEDAQNELLALEAKNPDWTRPSRSLAKHFKRLARLDLGLVHAEKAVKRSKLENQITASYKVLADLLVEMKRQDDAIERLHTALELVKEDVEKSKILDELAEVYSSTDNNEMQARAIEMSLKYTPANKERRFRLAYLYGDGNNSVLSLRHYKILVDQDPEHIHAVNNLGVAYGSFDLDGKKVSAWKSVGNIGESYSVVNLAKELIAAGFYEESNAYLENVPEEDRSTAHYLNAAGAVERSRKKEEEKLERTLEYAQVQHRYVMIAAEKDFGSTPQNQKADAFEGQWKSVNGKDRELSLNATDSNSMNGELTEILPLSPFDSRSSLISTQEKEVFDFYGSYNGATVTGSAHYNSVKSTASRGLFGDPDSRKYYLVVVNNDQLEGYYSDSDGAPSEVVFHRVK